MGLSNEPITLALLGLHIALQAAFVWGRYAVFRIEGQTPRGVRAIEASALPCIGLAGVAVALRAGPHAMLDPVAFIIGALSGWLFIWGARTARRLRFRAAFSPHAPGQLVTDGPYRWLRNPIYAAYLLAYAQALVAARTAWALPPLLWMAAIYHLAARHEEAQFLAGSFGAAYRRYASDTGRFMPRLRGIHRRLS